MSWNILSQDLIDTHRYLYANCSWQDLDWDSRWERIKIQLAQPHLTIICLQEVNGFHYFHYIKPFMDSLGFYSLYKKRGREKNDGCALFFDPKVFILEESSRMDFNQDVVCDEQRRDNIAIIARFKPRDNNNHQRVIVATTHLLYNPKRGDIKLAQLRMLLAEIRRLSMRRDNSSFHPIILAGDFNTSPESPLYDFIVKKCIEPIGFGRGELSGQHHDRGRIIESSDLVIKGISCNSTFQPRTNNGETQPNRHEDKSNGEVSRQEDMPEIIQEKISHDFDFESVYPASHPKIGVPFISTRVQGCASLVDYIFFVSSVKLVSLSYQSLPTETEVESIPWQPNQGMPSDHFPLQATFLLSP